MNIHSVTHLSTNVLHRTLLPNKQTGRHNKPRLVQHSNSIVTDQQPLPAPPYNPPPSSKYTSVPERPDRSLSMFGPGIGNWRKGSWIIVRQRCFNWCNWLTAICTKAIARSHRLIDMEKLGVSVVWLTDSHSGSTDETLCFFSSELNHMGPLYQYRYNLSHTGCTHNSLTDFQSEFVTSKRITYSYKHMSGNEWFFSLTDYIKQLIP